MRAVVLISFAALCIGCAYDSHSFADLPDEVDVGADAGGTPTPTPDAAPVPNPPDASISVPPLPEPDAMDDPVDPEDPADPEEPDAMVPVPPRGFGEPCTFDIECTGGMCRDFDGTSLCTQPCIDSDSCPDERTCNAAGYCEMGWGPGGGWPGGP